MESMKLNRPELLKEQAYINGEWVSPSSGASFEEIRTINREENNQRYNEI